MANNKYGYMAKIGADTTGITNALSDLNGKIKSTDKEIKALDRSIQSAEKTGTDTADLQRAKQEELRKAIADTTRKLQELQSVEQSVQQARDDGRITTEQYSQYRREITDTQSALNRYQAQLTDLTTAQQSNIQSTADLSLALAGVQSAYNQVAQDLSGIVDLMKGIADKAANAAVSLGKSAYQVGSSFEAAMSKMQAYSGAVGEDFEKLEEAAKNAGATTSKTATEAADALGYMALAGWDSEQMLEGLMPMIRAAEAGGGDLKRTSDLVTDSMSAMGVQVADLSHYLDVCTAAQSSSNTTLNQLLEAYINCGGTLRQLNVPMEESATLLGTLANRGMKAREAGTALNSILVNLMGANENAKKSLETLGVSAWNADGSFKGVTATLVELSDALNECTDQEKAFFEAKIGGKTQMDTLQALLSGVNEEYGQLYNTLSNVTGAAEQTADTMQDNLVGAVTTMKSAIEGLGVEFYDYMEEPIRDVVNTATHLVRELTDEIKNGGLGDKLTELSKKISEILEKLIEWATSKGFDMAIKLLEDLADGFNWLIDNMPFVISLVTEFGAAWAIFKGLKLVMDIGTLVTAIQVLISVTGEATAATTALSVAMSAIPAVAIGLAIAALGAYIGNYIVQLEIAKEKQARMSEENEKAIDTINDYRKSVDDLNKQLEENAEKTEDQITLANKAKKNLENLVDENGNLIGSQEDVEAQLGVLNETFGTHLEVINGQIQGYKDLQQSYDDYITSLREGIKKEAELAKYRQAVLDEQELGEKRTEYSIQRGNVERRLLETKKRIEELENLGEGMTENEAVELTTLYAQREELEKEYREFNQIYQAYVADWERAHKITTDYEEKLKQEQEQAKDESHIDRYQGRQTAEQAKAAETRESNLRDKSADADMLGQKKKDEVLKQLEDIENAYTMENIDEEEYYKQLAKVTDSEEYRRLFQDDPSSEFWRVANRVRSRREKDTKSTKTKQKTEKGKTAEQLASEVISKKKKELQHAGTKSGTAEYYNALKDPEFLDSLDTSTEAYLDLMDEIRDGEEKLAETAKNELEKKAEQDKKDAKSNYEAKKKELERKVFYSNGEYTDRKMYEELQEYAKRELAGYSDLLDEINLDLDKELRKISENEAKEQEQQAEKDKKAAEEATQAAIDGVKKELSDKLKQGVIDKNEYQRQLEDFLRNDTRLDRTTEAYKKAVADTTDDALDLMVDNAESDFEKLKKLYEDGAIDYETFVDRYLELAEKWSKEGIYLNGLVADDLESVTEKENKARQKEIEQWKKDAETLKKERETFYQSRDKLIKSYMGGNGVQTTEVDEKGGKKRKVFEDLTKKTKELEKYNENMQKLSQMENIPQELLDDIQQLSLDDRMAIVEELMKMGSGSREQYFKDYSAYYSAAKKAADYDLKDEAEALNAKIIEHNDTTKFEDMGKADAQAFVDGWNEIIARQNLFDTVNNIKEFLGIGTNGSGNGGNVGQSEMITLSADTPINFNIAGVETIKTTLKNVLSGIGLYGRQNRQI